MTSLLSNLRGTVQTAVETGRHLAWYVEYQMGVSGPREYQPLLSASSTRARSAA